MPIFDRNATRGQRFWSKVDVRGPDECWPWTGPVQSNGYGRFCYKRTTRSVGQVALELTTGNPFPKGMDACHTCDNRRCANPAHLWVGTRSDNMRDCAAKGRNAMQVGPHKSYFSQPGVKIDYVRGEKQGSAKLTEQAVRDIRNMRWNGVPVPVIARDFSISEGHVRKLALHSAWKHVDAALAQTTATGGGDE